MSRIALQDRMNAQSRILIKRIRREKRMNIVKAVLAVVIVIVLGSAYVWYAAEQRSSCNGIMLNDAYGIATCVEQPVAVPRK